MVNMMFSRLSEIRTHTVRILSASPLPVGLPIDKCIYVLAAQTGFEPGTLVALTANSPNLLQGLRLPFSPLSNNEQIEV